MFECQEVLEAPFAFENPPRAPSYERMDAEMFLNRSKQLFKVIFTLKSERKVSLRCLDEKKCVR